MGNRANNYIKACMGNQANNYIRGKQFTVLISKTELYLKIKMITILYLLGIYRKTSTAFFPIVVPSFFR